ncbi:uncharacterized protein CFAP97D2 isoform X2 [Bubalus bubalis]|uniref:uncharacterized protein CFAP97D2 isoform X2 n=1 Tax=Bubalus bubalis TaxID=89462 RepID=UPI00042CEF89|nr:uncharacterized protein CFAP97D2 isoform X2 [Bubalus bubalis]
MLAGPRLALSHGRGYLQGTWEKAYQDHRRKVREARPVVDSRAPPTLSHLRLKLGKLKLEEGRLSVIDRDNRLLLEKLSCIVRTGGRTRSGVSCAHRREKREQELCSLREKNPFRRGSQTQLRTRLQHTLWKVDPPPEELKFSKATSWTQKMKWREDSAHRGGGGDASEAVVDKRQGRHGLLGQPPVLRDAASHPGQASSPYHAGTATRV